MQEETNKKTGRGYFSMPVWKYILPMPVDVDERITLDNMIAQIENCLKYSPNVVSGIHLYENYIAGMLYNLGLSNTMNSGSNVFGTSVDVYQWQNTALVDETPAQVETPSIINPNITFTDSKSVADNYEDALQRLRYTMATSKSMVDNMMGDKLCELFATPQDHKQLFVALKDRKALEYSAPKVKEAAVKLPYTLYIIVNKTNGNLHAKLGKDSLSTVLAMYKDDMVKETA